MIPVPAIVPLLALALAGCGGADLIDDETSDIDQHAPLVDIESEVAGAPEDLARFDDARVLADPVVDADLAARSAADPAAALDAPPSFDTLDLAAQAVAVPGPARVTASFLNLRSGAGMGYRVLRVMPGGARVQVIAGPRSGWYNVTYSGTTGWTYGSWLAQITSGGGGSPTPTPSTTGGQWPLLRWGLHPAASDAMRRAGIGAERIMQTIGNYAASAGTHLTDGYVRGQPYSAATDISVRGLSATQIRNLLERMGQLGLAGWYRQPGYDGWPSSGAPHIHTVWTGAPMKSILDSQVRSWLAGRNGLVSNSDYRFYNWSAEAMSTVRRMFGASN
jgi:hypothetical protein